MRFPTTHVGTEHLLLGLLDQGGNLALRVLADLEIDEDDLRAELAGIDYPSNDTDARARYIPLHTVGEVRELELTAKEAMHPRAQLRRLRARAPRSARGRGRHREQGLLRRMGLELRTTRTAVVRSLVGVVSQCGAAVDPAGPTGDLIYVCLTAVLLERLDSIERRLEG